jgi:hypothetical protein
MARNELPCLRARQKGSHIALAGERLSLSISLTV